MQFYHAITKVKRGRPMVLAVLCLRDVDSIFIFANELCFYKVSKHPIHLKKKTTPKTTTKKIHQKTTNQPKTNHQKQTTQEKKKKIRITLLKSDSEKARSTRVLRRAVRYQVCIQASARGKRMTSPRLCFSSGFVNPFATWMQSTTSSG